jgi:hypothetical protein
MFTDLSSLHGGFFEVRQGCSHQSQGNLGVDYLKIRDEARALTDDTDGRMKGGKFWSRV